MNVSFEFHPTAVLVTPLFAIQFARCEDAACAENHWMVTVGWLLWELEVVW